MYDGLHKKKEGGRACADRRAPSHTSTATPRTRSCMRCAVGIEASAIHPAHIEHRPLASAIHPADPHISNIDLLPQIDTHNYTNQSEDRSIACPAQHGSTVCVLGSVKVNDRQKFKACVVRCDWFT